MDPRPGTILERVLRSERHTSAVGASLLPTPTASRYGSGQNGDPGGGRAQYKGKGKASLWTRAQRGDLPGHPRGPLSLSYLEWMMGFPIGWASAL